MTKNTNMLFGAALIATSVALPMAGPSLASPLLSKSGLTTAATSVVTDVRWRGGWRRHGHYGHDGWRHGYYRRGPGWGPALGGLAAGAIIGGAIANSNARAADGDAYCANRYRSYDPASGTYLGYDGNRHACP